MTLQEHMKQIGKTIQHTLGGLIIDVEIIDVKTSWGQVKYQITPVSGSGTVWIVAPYKD